MQNALMKLEKLGFFKVKKEEKTPPLRRPEFDREFKSMLQATNLGEMTYEDLALKTRELISLLDTHSVDPAQSH